MRKEAKMSVLKLAVAFVSGVGVGVLGTYAYFKKENEKKEAEITEHFHSKLKALRKDLKELREGKTEDDIVKEHADSKKKHRDYATKIEHYTSSVPITPNEVREKMAHPEDDIPEEQFQITSMDWFEDNLFEKKQVTYYVPDECLVGDSENLGEDILDIGLTIGHDAVDILMGGFDDGSAMFVRNPRSGVDYEITKSYSSFKEMSLR